MKKVFSTQFGTVELDVSDKACLPFGFKSGTKIIKPFGEKVTVLGVANGAASGKECFKKCPRYQECNGLKLWYRNDSGIVNFWGSSPKDDPDLRKQGFTLLS